MGYQALLFCPDEKLARIVTQVFSELEFAVEPVNEPFAAVNQLMTQRYDALVVDCEDEQNSALLFKSARNSSSNQGSLAIALVEGQTGVAKAYRIGANLVVTKPINIEQAKGTLRVARGLLRKSTDAATAASRAASGTPAKAVPAASAHTIQPANRNVEAVAPPPTPKQAPEFAAPLPAMAASARIEEKPAPSPEPAAQNRTPVVVQAPAGTTLFAAEEAKKEVAQTEAPKPAAVPVLNTASRSQGAASAPAPAKEAAAPPKKQVEKEEPTEIGSAAQAQVDSSSAVRMLDSTSFTVLAGEHEGGSGGSKRILIAAVAVLALAAAGFYGWTKFGPAQPTATPHPVTTTPQKGSEPAPEVRPMSAPAPAPVAGTTERASAATIAPAPRTSSAQIGGTGSSSGTQTGEIRIAIRPEPKAKEPASAPSTAKPAAAPAVKAQAQTEESPVQLPSPTAVTSPSGSGLGGILSSASSSAAKPVLTSFRVSQGVTQGMVIKRVQPRYPANALAAHIQGAVQIEATVNKEGVVVNPKVLSGDRALAAAALEAVRQWRYKPYYLDGEPVEIQTQITVNFKSQQ